jgi:hypothetical protein
MIMALRRENAWEDTGLKICNEHATMLVPLHDHTLEGIVCFQKTLGRKKIFDYFSTVGRRTATLF